MENIVNDKVFMGAEEYVIVKRMDFGQLHNIARKYSLDSTDCYKIYLDLHKIIKEEILTKKEHDRLEALDRERN